MSPTVKTLLLLVFAPLSLLGQADQIIGVKVETVGMDVVTEPLRVKALISNSSDSSATILSTKLILPDQVAALPRELETDFPRGTFDLDAKGFHELEARVPNIPLRQAWRVAFFRSKSYDFKVRLEFLVAGNQTRHSTTADFTIAPLAPWWTVILGGIVGVPLVLLFLFLYDKARGATAAAHPPKTATSILLGWAVVLLATLVFRLASTAIPDLPIAINVKDILGGVLVGLVYKYLAHMFSAMFTPTAQTPTGVKG